MNPSPLILLAALGLFAGDAVAAENTEPAPAPTVESLQRQIEELRAGQRQVLDELRELKQLLKEAPERREVASIPEPPRVITQNIRGEPFRGDAAARVAILEYSDFNCSYCTKYATNIYPRLERDYVRTGRVRYLFRDLPDKLDADSLVKAQAARCAGEQGKFWEMHDRLFLNPAPLLQNPSTVEQHVLALRLDAAKFTACLQSGRYASPIQRVANDAQRFGLHGTPSFLIGRTSDTGEVVWATKVVLGAESYEALRANLDEFFPATPK